MSVFDKVKELVTSVVDEGRGRAGDLRERRDRARLVGELGEACYRQTKGDADAGAEIDRLVASIDELEATGSDEPEVDLRTNDEPSESSGAEPDLEGTESSNTP